MMKKKVKHSQRTNHGLIKSFMGTLLIFPCYQSSGVLFGYLSGFDLTISKQLTFVTGAGVYIIMHLLLWKPIFIHIMGHELTHAFWALLHGGKIKSLLVSENGGQVTISKTNFLIALSPYFFPIYTFLLIPIFIISADKYKPLLTFLFGFTLSFHYFLTFFSLKDEQSDIRQVGIMFSFPFIYVMNVLILAIVLSIIFPELITLMGYLKTLYYSSIDAMFLFFQWLIKLKALIL